MTTENRHDSHASEALQMDLEAYADGECDAATARRIREHIATCSACLANVAATTDLNAALRPLPDERAPAALWPQIAGRLDMVDRGATVPTERSWSTRYLGGRFRLAAMGIAACLALLAAFGAWHVLMPSRDMIAPIVQDFITYRDRGWTVDHDARDSRSVAAWAQTRVSFAVPDLKQRIGSHEIGGVRLCWLLERRLIGVTYLSGSSRAVLYVLDGEGLTLPKPDYHLANHRPVAVRHLKGHGVAVWTENDLVFVLVAADLDFERVLAVASQRSCPLPSLATRPYCTGPDTSTG
ncbi:MAG: zf-HC2 domain-containing protein [Hyphomicrobium sp.]